jgi:hypothetical protein
MMPDAYPAGQREPAGLATRNALDQIAALGTPLAGICVELLTFFAGSYRLVFGFDAPPLHDPVAMGLDAGRLWGLIVAAVAALG